MTKEVIKRIIKLLEESEEVRKEGKRFKPYCEPLFLPDETEILIKTLKEIS